MRSKSTIHTIYRASVACFIFGAGVSLFGYLSSSSLWYVGAGLGILGLLFDMAALLYRKCELDSSAQGFRAFLDNAFSIDYLFEIASYWSDRPRSRRTLSDELFEHKGIELGTPGSVERRLQCGIDPSDYNQF